MRRFLVPDLPPVGKNVSLTGPAAHHLLAVARIRVGEKVELFDGQGSVGTAELLTGSSHTAVARILSVRQATPEHAVHLLLGVAKGPSMDRAIRMATEAGVTTIHPVISKRSVARGDRGERWRRIAVSAAQQCGRGDVPTILPLLPLREAHLPQGARWVAHPGSTPPQGPFLGGTVLVGPEGGLAPDELAWAADADFAPLCLGRWILRTDTAAAIAVAALSGD